jgi:PST family polysaccharide transporter
MTNLRDKTLKGLVWSIIAQFTKQSLRFVISVILARLLAPKDFGLVGMIIVFTGFAGLFSELGFGAALIQRKEIEERHLSSIFWLNIVSGLILTGIVLAVAPFIATFYNEPRLKLLTMLISVNFFIGSLNTVQTAILNRSMDFRKLAIIETITMIIAGSSAITLAFMGFGVWSLAWQILISTTVGVIIMWQVSDWKPKLSFDKNAVKELIGFSSNLLGFNVFNYWVRNSDNLLIGKFIGSAGLGIYARAYGIMFMPLSQISATVGQVMFPSLSKIQKDKVRVKEIYLRAISVIALVTFPMMMGLLVVADSFVIALFGPKWIEVIPILQIMCMLGLVQSLVTTLGWIYTSQGRTDWFFWWSVGAGVLLILSILIGIWIGTIIAVAVCYALMSGVILLYPAFAIPGKLINMTFSEVVRSVSGVFGCAVLMAGGVYLLGVILPSEWPHWANLLSQVPFGIIIYIVLIHLLRQKNCFGSNGKLISPERIQYVKSSSCNALLFGPVTNIHMAISP